MKTIKPLSNYVVAEITKGSDKSELGLLLLPKTKNEQPRIAKVVAVGSGVTLVKVSDEIIFQAFAAVEIEIDGQKLICVQEKYILGVIDQ